jgi:chromosomal replication initiation ATPase DnaA
MDTTLAKPNTTPVSMLSIAKEVAAKHGLLLSDLVGESVTRKTVVLARHEAMWRMREVRCADGRRRYSYPCIGIFFGRNHTTVIHACKGHARRNGLGGQKDG